MALADGQKLQEIINITDVPDDAAEEPGLQADQASTITERLQALLSPARKAEDIRELRKPARVLLEAGLVFAVHVIKGGPRYARVSLVNGSLHIHSLQAQPPPPDAAILQMNHLMPAAPPCMVFLDLAWPGSASRRVLIRLTPDTPMGRQFVLLCTGQHGPSYVNTRLWGVDNKGQPGEWVTGGDYENNDGTGGVALLPNLDKGEYNLRSGRAGIVTRVYRHDKPEWNAWFGISTRDHQDGSLPKTIFGEVVDGLEIVAAAAQHSPIKEVTVVDCGVVL